MRENNKTNTLLQIEKPQKALNIMGIHKNMHIRKRFWKVEPFLYNVNYNIQIKTLKTGFKKYFIEQSNILPKENNFIMRCFIV